MGICYWLLHSNINQNAKKAIHLISSKGYLSHTEPLFKKLNLQQVPKIHIYKILIFMYKVHHCTAPDIFQEMFTGNNSVHNYGTRQKDKLRVPHVNKSKMKNSIRVKVTLWNYMSKQIPFNCSIETWKNMHSLLGSNLHYTKLMNP